MSRKIYLTLTKKKHNYFALEGVTDHDIEKLERSIIYDYVALNYQNRSRKVENKRNADENQTSNY